MLQCSVCYNTRDIIIDMMFLYKISECLDNYILINDIHVKMVKQIYYHLCHFTIRIICL